MSIKLNYNKSISKMADQYADAEAVGIGSKLTLVICAIRAGLLVPPKEGKKNWTGQKTFLELPEMTSNSVLKQDVSRATEVVSTFLMNGDEKDVTLCDDDQVKDLVLAFMTEYSSLWAAYDAAQAVNKGGSVGGEGEESGEPTPKVWDLNQALATVFSKATKVGMDPITVALAVETAYNAAFGGSQHFSAS